MIKKIVLVFILFTATTRIQAQYWQQKVDYTMEIEFDSEAHQYDGKQVLVYYNNSPDTLTKVYYHLYNNAFQPGSMMDIHEHTLPDATRQMLLIEDYKQSEIGYLNVISIKSRGQELDYNEIGTIVKVKLDKPLLPGKKVELIMDFKGQVPIQTRRSGRNTIEGIAYSMSQWYPKICEYDKSGWHADPYLGREFYGVWGDFDVKITIDSDFILGGSGKVMNPKEVKHGYGGYIGKPDADKITWHFKSSNVHDFMWAADKHYVHDRIQVGDDLEVHLLYLNDSIYAKNWHILAGRIPQLFNYVNNHYGKYDFDTFSVIQGGDRGMEYPMSTLITGNRSEGSLIGVTIHELLHSWYYMALGTNENAYPWMDEGFTSYTAELVKNYMFKNDSSGISEFIQYKKKVLALLKDDRNEVLSTSSNRYSTNLAYSINAYSKGVVYLHQLSYIIGQDNLNKTLFRYYNEWKYKHPGPGDFILVAEKVSGMELHWYNDYYIYSDKKIDYSISSLIGTKSEIHLLLKNEGEFPMPVDLRITLMNGEIIEYTIPLQMMWGNKKMEEESYINVLKPWRWVEKEYLLSLPFSIVEVSSIEIDPDFKTLDIDRENNSYLLSLPENTEIFIDK